MGDRCEVMMAVSHLVLNYRSMPQSDLPRRRNPGAGGQVERGDQIADGVANNGHGLGGGQVALDGGWWATGGGRRVAGGGWQVVDGGGVLREGP